MAASDEAARILDTINRTGFPLQIAVEYLINSNPRCECNVLFREHSWQDRERGESGFIDLIIEQIGRNSTFVIECKRVLESQWIFLQLQHDKSDRRHVKLWETEIKGGKYEMFGWTDRTLEPSSPESAFCVVDGQDSKSQPMLERVAAQLLSATEAFARADIPRVIANPSTLSTLYVSVIVTTAKLSLATLDPGKISLADGRAGRLATREMPFIRFRKQLSFDDAKLSVGEAHNVRAISYAKERTVFVVNVESLLSFLGGFEVDIDRAPAVR